MPTSHEVLIVGGGAAGIAVAASLRARLPGIDIAIVEPATTCPATIRNAGGDN